VYLESDELPARVVIRYSHELVSGNRLFVESNREHRSDGRGHQVAAAAIKWRLRPSSGGCGHQVAAAAHIIVEDPTPRRRAWSRAWRRVCGSSTVGAAM
jgi:hypothetical protein